MTYSRIGGSEAEGNPAKGTAFIFRTVVGVLATLLGVFALWILVAEITNPPQNYFPSNLGEAKAAYAGRGAAVTAAEIGMVRGDLWTTAAVAATAPLLFGTTDGRSDHPSQEDFESMHALADRAARLSPHDPRIWLVLAALDFRADAKNPKGTEALKLSYYTGANEISLMPVRLLIAVRSNAILDDEVQSLMPLDIQRMMAQRPDLKSAIVTAYSNALPKGREIMQTTLKETDPNFLATLAVPHPANLIAN